MAGSRTEKYGTIYTRVKGLLQSGAMKEIDKPLWYDVFEAFPPRDVPKPSSSVTNVLTGKGPVRPILYPEDVIRAKFYNVFGNTDVIDLTQQDPPTTSLKFINEFTRLQAEEGGSEVDIFDRTTDILRRRGIRLRSHEDLEKERPIKFAENVGNSNVLKPDNSASVTSRILNESTDSTTSMGSDSDSDTDSNSSSSSSDSDDT